MKTLITSVIMAVLLMTGQSAWSAIPRTISYQGYLAATPDNVTFTGAAQMTFSLYEDATVGSPLWTESLSAVPVVKGGYTVLLGKSNALELSFDKVYYLGVKVGTDTEMVPRHELSASPFAFRTINADSADTLSLSCNDGQILGYSTSSTSWRCVDGAVNGGGTWGTIKGTLTNQSDLAAALTGKVSTSTTINGRSLNRNVSLIAADLNLGNVNNTTDMNKPVSLAMQTALNGKAASGSNADITRLSGLKTAITVPQGGTGSTALTGYVKGSGTNALTASTSIPVADISGLGTFATKSQASLTADVTGILPVTKGGTGSTTRNFVNLTDSETINGTKTFSNVIIGSVSGNAITATTATKLSAGSTLPSDTLAATQDIVDNSDKIATTKFVHSMADSVSSRAASGANSDIISTSSLTTVTTTEATDFTLLTGGSTSIIPKAGSIKLTGGAAVDNDQDTAVGGSVVLTGGDFIGMNEVGMAGSVTISGGSGGNGTGGDVVLSAGKGILAPGAVKVQGLRIMSQNTTSTNTPVLSTTTPSFGVKIAAYSDISSSGVNLTAPSNTTLYTLTLPPTAGTRNQVLATDGTGILSWTTPISGTVTDIKVSAPVLSSGGPVPTISITKADGTTDGYLSATDFKAFNDKQNASANLNSFGTLTNSSGWLNNNGSGLLSYKNPTSADVGLGNVTNDVQTKAAIVPNTAPTAGQILIGNINKAFTAQSVSGDGSFDATGTLTITKTEGQPFGRLAKQSSVNLTSSTDVTGTLPVANGGTGLGSNLAVGGLLYASNATTLSSLKTDTSGLILTSAANAAPSWSKDLTLSGNLTVTGTTSLNNTIINGSSTFTTGTGAVSLNGNTILGAGKSLSFSNSSNKKIGFAAPTTINSEYTLSLPPAAPGTNGQVLASDTGGNLSWAPIMTIPAGTVVAYMGVTAPPGWVMCNGASVTITSTLNTDYVALYQLLYGTTSATGTLVLPDMRGRFLRGLDNGANRDFDTGTRGAEGAGKSGSNVGSVQSDAFANHDHGVSAQGRRTTASPDNANGVTVIDPGTSGGWFNNIDKIDVLPSGGSETRPKNIAVNYIIKK